MDIFKIFEKRHCYRGAFENTPVPREDLKKIVMAGILAPSGKNAQTTDFIIVDDTKLIEQIAETHPTSVMKTAKALIVCLVDKEPDDSYFGMSFVVEDCAAAVENMFLAITALGYGTVWLDGAIRREKRNENISKILHVPETKEVRIILPLGIPKEEASSPKKKSFNERAFFNTYP
jgi:nitroreductase